MIVNRKLHNPDACVIVRDFLEAPQGVLILNRIVLRTPFEDILVIFVMSTCPPALPSIKHLCIIKKLFIETRLMMLPVNLQVMEYLPHPAGRAYATEQSSTNLGFLHSK